MNLKWTHAKRDKFYAHKKRKFYTGVSCVFFKLTEHVGIKLFTEKSRRDFAYFAQRKGYTAGIAPNVGSRVCFRSGNKAIQRIKRDKYSPPLLGPPGYMVYGYLTEIATSIGKITESEDTYLERKIKELGFSAEDLHDENIGRLRDKPVCIDWDPISLDKNSKEWSETNDIPL